jgi:hypothetical protein
LLSVVTLLLACGYDEEFLLPEFDRIRAVCRRCDRDLNAEKGKYDENGKNTRNGVSVDVFHHEIAGSDG